MIKIKEAILYFAFLFYIDPILSVPSSGQGHATFYYVGLGSCGVQNGNSEYVAALNNPQYTSNADVCGKCIRVTYGRKNVIVKLVVSNLIIFIFFLQVY